MTISRPDYQIVVPVLIVLLIAAVLWAVFDPAHYELCEKSIHTGHEECSSHRVAAFLFLKLGRILDAWSAAITALATVAVAVFTWTIWSINKAQLKHNREVERAYISAGGLRRFDPVQTGPGQFQLRDTGHFEFHVNNYGKTQGKVFQIGWGFCEDHAVPVGEPTYHTTYFNSWIAPGRTSLPLDSIQIPNNLVSPAVYGRVYYETIFGERFSSGLLYRIPNRPGASESIAPPNPLYTDERTEPTV